METKVRRMATHGASLFLHLIAGAVFGSITYFASLLISHSIFLFSQTRHGLGFAVIRWNYEENGFSYFLPDLDRAETGILIYVAPFFGAALGAAVLIARKIKPSDATTESRR